MNRTEHLMVKGMEECAETAKRLSKALRFGLEEVWPDPYENPTGQTNRAIIVREFNDLHAVMRMLGLAELDETAIEAHQVKTESFLNYSRTQGTLND